MANNLPQNIITELVGLLQQADLTMRRIIDLTQEEETLRAEAADNRARSVREEKERKKGLIRPFLLYIPCLFPTFISVLFIFGFLEEYKFISVDSQTWFFLVFTITFALTSIGSAVLFICAYKNRSYIVFEEQAQALEVQAEWKRQTINKTIEDNKDCLSIIAPEFRFPEASTYLIMLFEQGRASSLPEAYDKLELRLHQMKVEEGLGTIIDNQIAQLAYLSTIANNS